MRLFGIFRGVKSPPPLCSKARTPIKTRNLGKAADLHDAEQRSWRSLTSICQVNDRRSLEFSIIEGRAAAAHVALPKLTFFSDVLSPTLFGIVCGGNIGLGHQSLSGAAPLQRPP